MLAERFVIEANWATDAQLAIARFVNVEETRGNVFELWRQQIAAGQAPEITDLRMERHFNTIEKVQDLFEHILRDMRGGEVFIPDVPKLRVIERFQQLYGANHPYRVVGIRRNEKLYDPLYTDEEAPFVERRDGYLVIDYNRIREAYAARLAEEASRFTLVKSELRSGINKILQFITYLLWPTGLLIIYTQLFTTNVGWRESVLRMVGALVPMVPEGLVLMTNDGELAHHLTHPRYGHEKVYDVTVDGVSLVTNYRGTFATQIRDNGLDAVIADLQQRNSARSPR